MIRIFQRHCNYRGYPENKGRPGWFDRERIFDSLMESLDERVEYTAIHDSGRGVIEDHFLNNKNVTKVSMFGGSDSKSLLNMFNYISEQNYTDDDIIYLVEDDYLHKPGWMDVMLEGFDYIGADYYTLYDHPDKYYLPMYENLQSKLIITKSVHWRTTPSTCNTYAAKWKTFKKHWDNHHIYWCKPENTHDGYDHTKFLKLWEDGSNLVSCIPGYATHVETNMLSPLTDWSEV
jgi:hypothetical protein